MRTPTALLALAVAAGLLTACDPAISPMSAPTTTVSPSVVTSGGVPSLPPVPDLTGQPFEVADATARALNFSTTPEDPHGDTLTITDPGDWTVCTQTPGAHTRTTSNGILLTVVDTAAGAMCPDTATSTPTPAATRR